MNLLRSSPARTLAVCAAMLVSGALAACEDDGQDLPERCQDPALEVFDSRHTPPPADDNEQYPCVTPVGHAVSGNGVGGDGGGVAPPAGGAAGAAGAAEAGAGGA